MAEAATLIGIDVGTTAVKGGLFGLDGRILAHAARSYPTRRPQHGWVEQDPADWMAAIDAILADLLKDHDPAKVVAFGLCSQVNTDVFVDANGQALLPAFVWQDGRAAGEAERLNARISPDQWRAWRGAPFGVDASHVLARMAWVARHHPEIWARTAHVLSPKDYCLKQLTGEISTDPLSSFGVVDLKGRYIPDLLALVPGATERLAPLSPFERVIGHCRRAAFPGLDAPVIAGTMDAWGNLFGSGVAEIGEGAYFSGTSEIITLVSEHRRGAPGVVTFLPVNGWNVHAGPTQSGGDSLRWFADIMGQPIETVLAKAAEVDRHQQRALFLPHLQGERAPLWDPYSRGTFLGLDSASGLGTLTLAVLEGVACSARLLFESVSKAAGRDYPSLYLGGGGARSDLWCQIRADMLGIPLKRLAFLDTGVLGAAIMAGAGTGLYGSIAEATRNMVKVDRSFTPDPAYRTRYGDLIGQYTEAYQALKPLYRRMNG